ncbi:hypothetical protein ACH5RR_000828 [Cinchona calisaya]|uniref:FAR1 domain-containing protein n=1 Tax=Cinchona calisaya TaxID=153742 RepID=A0ABD3B2V2_9GENT
MEGQSNNETSEAVCIDDLDYNEVMGMKLTQLKKQNSSILYMQKLGFGIRKHDIKTYNDGGIRYRKWTCCRQGERDAQWINMENLERDHRSLTRVNCDACFPIKYDVGEAKFIVTEFSIEHNRPLAQPSTMPFLRSHRHILDSDYAQAKS